MPGPVVIDGPAGAVRPRLRGVLHQWAFVASLGTGILLVALASTPRARIGSAVYALSVSGLFGVSALYHRVSWSLRVRPWMRRLDHSMIFVLIAGTYTPLCLMILPGGWAAAVLAAVWAAAVVGILSRLAWLGAPTWLTLCLYLALGWVALPTTPAVFHRLGFAALALLLVSGVLYTVGAVIYGIRRPDPVPAVFGYHEVFHALVIAAAAIQYVVIVVAVT
jgi:hemolysin III